MKRRSFLKFITGIIVGTSVSKPIISDTSSKITDEQFDYLIKRNELYGGSAGGGKSMSLEGIPYHENNASAGTWMGIDRTPYKSKIDNIQIPEGF